jgi:DNA replication and repair protein RecF
MLRLNKIALTHFKNYDFSPFEFSSNVVAISGLNGIGKTNLLDAIYYCCFTKSYFTGSDAMSVNFEKKAFAWKRILKRTAFRKRSSASTVAPAKRNFL